MTGLRARRPPTRLPVSLGVRVLLITAASSPGRVIGHQHFPSYARKLSLVERA